LHDWITAAVAEENWDGKGLLVINPFRTKPPGSRGKTMEEPTRRVVERNGLAVLTTTQLFVALTQHQSGALDVRAFWSRVREAVGLVDIPELGPPPETEPPSDADNVDG
jgi:hypothetical protein